MNCIASEIHSQAGQGPAAGICRSRDCADRGAPVIAHSDMAPSAGAVRLRVAAVWLRLHDGGCRRRVVLRPPGTRLARPEAVLRSGHRVCLRLRAVPGRTTQLPSTATTFDLSLTIRTKARPSSALNRFAPALAPCGDSHADVPAGSSRADRHEADDLMIRFRGHVRSTEPTLRTIGSLAYSRQTE